MESSFRTLYYYIVTAEELNFTRAAKKLYITQQSLSAHIKKLEEQYETQLFERKPTLRLTWAGERLLKYARHVISDENALLDDLKNENNRGKIRLPIAIPPQRVVPYLADIYAAFRQLYPHVIPAYITHSYTDADSALRNGEVKLYYSMMELGNKFGKQLPLVSDEVYFTVSETLLKQVYPETWRSFAARHRSGIRVMETIDFPVVLPPTVSSQRLLMDLQYDKAGRSPNLHMEASNNELAFDVCSRGFCGVFVPKSQLYKNRGGLSDTRLYFFPVTDLQEVSYLSIIYPGEAIPEYVKAYIDCAKEVILACVARVEQEMNEAMPEDMALSDGITADK